MTSDRQTTVDGFGSYPRLARTLAPLALATLIAACSAATATIVPTPSPTLTLRPTAQPTYTVVTLPPEPTPTPEPAGPTQYSPGDVITITKDGADWATIVISGVKQVSRYRDPYVPDVPAPGNIYIQAFVTYTALTNGVDYNEFDWQVFVAGVAVNNTAFVSNGPKPELGSGTLPKGRVAKGWLVYEVPKTGKVLLSYGGGSFSNQAPIFEVVLRGK